MVHIVIKSDFKWCIHLSRSLFLYLKRLHASSESTLNLHFTDVGSPGHQLQGIILDISTNRLFKAVRVDEPTETRNRPFLNVKFAIKGIDALNVGNILNQKSVQNKIPPYFQYKESSSFPIAIPVLLLPKSSITEQVCTNSTFKVFSRISNLATALIHNFGTLHVAI